MLIDVLLDPLNIHNEMMYLLCMYICVYVCIKIGMKHKGTVKALSKKYTQLEVLEEEDENAGTSVDGISIQKTEEVSEDRVWTAPKEEPIHMESLSPQMRADPTLPGRLLEFHTENGHWTGLKAPLEELLQS